MFHYLSFLMILVSGVLLVPLYLKYIPTQVYGAWLAVGNVLAWISLMDPGLSTVAMQRVATAHGRGNLEEIRPIVSAALVVALVPSLAILMLGWAISSDVWRWVGVDDAGPDSALARAFLVAVVGAALNVYSHTPAAINLGLQRTVAAGVIFMFACLSAIAVTVWLLLAGYGVLGLAAGIFVRGALLLIGNGGYITWRLGMQIWGAAFHRSVLADIGRMSLYQSLAQIGNALGSQIEAFVLARALGPGSVPAFVLTKRALDLLRMLAERPSAALIPALAHANGAGEVEKAKHAVIRLARMVIWMTGLLIGGTWTFNRDFVTLWVGSGMFAGPVVNGIVCLAIMVSIFSNSLRNLCQALGDIRGTSIALFCENVICAITMLVTVRYWGLIGAAISPLVAALLIPVWYYPLSIARILGITLSELRGIAKESLLTGATLVLPVLVFGETHWESWKGFACAVIAFSAMYCAGIYTISLECRQECSLIREVVLRHIGLAPR